METKTGICASLKFEFISTQPEINSSFREVQNVVFKKLKSSHDSTKTFFKQHAKFCDIR